MIAYEESCATGPLPAPHSTNRSGRRSGWIRSPDARVRRQTYQFPAFGGCRSLDVGREPAVGFLAGVRRQRILRHLIQIRNARRRWTPTPRARRTVKSRSTVVARYIQTVRILVAKMKKRSGAVHLRDTSRSACPPLAVALRDIPSAGEARHMYSVHTALHHADQGVLLDPHFRPERCDRTEEFGTAGRVISSAPLSAGSTKL